MAKVNKQESHVTSSNDVGDIYAGFKKHPTYDVYIASNVTTRDQAQDFVDYRPTEDTSKINNYDFNSLVKNVFGFTCVKHNYLYDNSNCVSDKSGNLYLKDIQIVDKFRPLRIHPIFANEPHISHKGDRFQCPELDDYKYHDFTSELIFIKGYEGRSLRRSKTNPIYYTISDWTFMIETFNFHIYRPDLPESCDFNVKTHLQEEYVELANIEGGSRKVRIIHPQRFGDSDAHLVHGFMNYPIDADFKMMLRTMSYDSYIRSSAEVSISTFEA
jgi:hypothetical protein